MNDDLLDWHNDQDKKIKVRRRMNDLEDSNSGRSDRFVPGCFILPSMVIGCIMWYFIVKWIMSLF